MDESKKKKDTKLGKNKVQGEKDQKKKKKWERNPALTMHAHNSSSLFDYFLSIFN